MSTKGSHPEIGSLIRLKDDMWKALEEGNHVLGLRKMLRILMDIKEADSPKPMREKIRLELIGINSNRFNRKASSRVDRMSRYYWDWGHKVVQILWDKDYLIDDSYGKLVAAAGERKSGDKAYTPIPTELPNVVKSQ